MTLRAFKDQSFARSTAQLTRKNATSLIKRNDALSLIDEGDWVWVSTNLESTP